MSSTGAEKRPSLWSYLSFGSPGHARRRSVSLPAHRQSISSHDPYEKPGRHGEMANGSAYPRNGPAMTKGQRSILVKITGIVAFLIVVMFFLTPSENRTNVIEMVHDHAPYTPHIPHRAGQVASDPALGTKKCSTSSHSSKPIVQYAIMVDAGSTGSRIHVYRFNNCGDTPELESEDFKMTEKKTGGSGLSSYKTDAESAAKSLDPLLEVAMKAVPDKLKSCTPIAVKATAGLRLLGPELSDKILAAVRNRLETVYPFAVVSSEKGGVQIMDGRDEGVYAWITTNYLLGKIGGPDKTPTAAIFDLGGGSTQIVFEPTFPYSPSGGMPEKLAEGDHKYDIDFGGRHFSLYQHSHLGYGLMSAREAMHKLVLQARVEKDPHDSSWTDQDIINPCIAPGMRREITVKLEEGRPVSGTVTVNMTGPDSGSAAQCRAIAEQILQKDAKCELAPCSFNGVHQPPLARTFAREDVYIFSYFYDRTQPLGMPESFTIRELHELAEAVCHGKTGWARFEGIKGALEELQDRPETCLDLNFMLALLHTGYEMSIDREVKIAKRIKGNELGWCLGASLPLLGQGSGWKCRIKEVT